MKKYRSKRRVKALALAGRTVGAIDIARHGLGKWKPWRCVNFHAEAYMIDEVTP